MHESFEVSPGANNRKREKGRIFQLNNAPFSKNQEMKNFVGVRTPSSMKMMKF